MSLIGEFRAVRLPHVIAMVEGDPEGRFLRAHREAMERIGWKCRFCHEDSSTATCDACADEAGW